MTDQERIARLRNLAVESNDGALCGPALGAADRIEAQAAEIERLRGDLAKAVEALEHAKLNMPHPDQMIDDSLAALKGDKP